MGSGWWCSAYNVEAPHHFSNGASRIAKPLPLGKGPPTGRGIGRQMTQQSVSSFEANYVCLTTLSGSAHAVVSPVPADQLPAHFPPYPPCPPFRGKGGTIREKRSHAQSPVTSYQSLVTSHQSHKPKQTKRLLPSMGRSHRGATQFA